MNTTKKTVAVGMSGGVDSSVAAAILLEQGYNVFGITLRVLPPLSAPYNPETDSNVIRARAVAKKLGIKHYVAICSDTFTNTVLKECANDFANARTPNPCCYCNRYIKFGWMMDFAKEHGADFLATGHYVNICKVDNVNRLFRGIDIAKDQSYFLFGVDDAHRARIITPLGNMIKSDVRKLAAQYGFVNANDSDSQDICFDIYSDSYTEFLTNKFGCITRPGNFVTENGKVLNAHTGYHKYTIGQRKGLGVALGVPAFVQSIDKSTGNIIVTPDKSAVCKSEVFIKNCVWHGNNFSVNETFECMGMVRYRQHPVNCLVKILENGTALAKFEHPVFAVTGGQCAVFYSENLVLGGGWISKRDC